MITTQAWVLHRGPDGMDPRDPVPGELVLEPYSFPDLTDDEVLVEPLYGCWEGNMGHAIRRDPVDIVRQRGEDKIVLGNSGCVRVLQTGAAVTGLREGDVCGFVCHGVTDPFGYVELVHGYDAPNTIGIMGKRVKVPQRTLVKLPENTRHPLRRWAADGRYWTAYDNWKVASTCWRAQMDPGALSVPLVFGWGGGVVLGELLLAKNEGFTVAMASGNQKRLDQLAELGIIPVDRRLFPDLDYDAARAKQDREYAQRQKESEQIFLGIIGELSKGYGVSIFLDNIGGPLYRPTLKSLGRQAVISTVGWKEGMRLETMRAIECIRRHTHVHTHAFVRADVEHCIQMQEAGDWLPDVDAEDIYSFDEIPSLAQDYDAGRIDSYFPLYQINEE